MSHHTFLWNIWGRFLSDQNAVKQKLKDEATDIQYFCYSWEISWIDQNRQCVRLSLNTFLTSLSFYGPFDATEDVNLYKKCIHGGLFSGESKFAALVRIYSRMVNLKSNHITSPNATVLLTYVFLIVYRKQWSSMAQIRQALTIQQCFLVGSV